MDKYNTVLANDSYIFQKTTNKTPKKTKKQKQKKDRGFGTFAIILHSSQCPSPLKLWVQTQFMARCTPYNIMW